VKAILLYLKSGDKDGWWVIVWAIGWLTNGWGLKKGGPTSIVDDAHLGGQV